MEVRPLEEADLPTVRALLGALIREHAEQVPDVIRLVEELDPFSNGENASLTLRLVAVVDGRVVGFAQGEIEMPPPHDALVERRFFALYDLVVEPSMRRHGVASQLLEACEAWLRERGVSSIELNVFSFNEDAIAFYQRNGFRVQRLRLAKKV